MSWFNNTSTEFIDGTQQFTGGVGGNTIPVNGGSNINITDLIELRLDHTGNEYEEPNPSQSFNLYIKNTNTTGEIRFYTDQSVFYNDVSNSALIYNVKIANDGMIYGYYTYNPIISVATTSRWINLTEGIVSAQQAGDNALITATGAVGAAGAAQLTANTALTEAQLAINAASQAASSAAAANASVNSLVNTFDAFKWTRQTLNETFEAIGDASFNTLRLSIQQRASLAITAMASSARAQVRLNIGSMSLSAFNLATSIVGAYVGAGITTAVVAGIAYLFDYLKQEDRRATIQQYIRLLEEDQANGSSLGTTQDVLTLTGLQIFTATNTGFTTAGTYEVDIVNDARLEIVISSGLTATITRVIGGGDSFTTGTTISIPKSELGGGTGNLDILITSLITEKEFIENDLLRLGNEIVETDNRNRRRRNIPNTSSFSTDGFSITNTQITEPDLGEITNEPTIGLKIDTSQFSYDATGNLQINNYGTIPVNPSQFQYIGGNLELISYSQIAQNQTDISTIQGNITTMLNDINTNALGISTNAGNILANSSAISTNTTNIATNTANISTNASGITLLNTSLGITNGNVTTNATAIANIQSDITSLNSDKTDIFQLILNDGETPSTTTTKQVNIGFNKSEFNNIIFPLIMGAVKLTSTQEIAFNITDFRGYYFGTYPDMTRLNYNPTITLVKQDNSYYYNDTNWNSGGLIERGAYYFKNDQTGFVYDLNKRFEYLGFHRFKINISGQNTYVIRTALEFEEQVGVFNYQPDPDKLQFYLRDGNFYFSHLCRYDLTYYAIRFNQNILSDFINPVATFSSVISPTGNNRGTLNLNITTAPFNEDYYLRIDDSLEGITRTQMENLFDTTTTHSNERFCGMVQNYISGQINATHEEFGSITLFQSQYTTNYKIARIELEYQFKIRDQTNAFWIVSNPQTQSVLSSIVEELVFDFYNSYTDTTPADTIPLNNRVIFSTTTNTISINFDKSPDTQYYLYEKWRIRPRFISGYNGYVNQSNPGYNYLPNQRSCFIKKVKLFPYIQKTITREVVEEFTNGTTHSLSAFDYNKINLHINLNNHISPYNDIWYKLNDNLDANKYQITIPQSFNTTNFTGITDLPPNVTSLPTDNFDFLNFDLFVSSGQQSITELNDILIIGDEDIGITQYETHFGWRFLQPTDNNMSETDLDNYDYLKTYNYYHRTAICDRFFSCKEFYADIIDFKNLLVDGNLAYDDMTTSEFSTLSQNSEGFSLKSLSSVNIQNLYGLIANGFVYFDTINGFSTQTSSVTNYWTQQSAVEISYPYTISVDRVNTNTIVLTSGSPSASITFSDGSFITTAQGLSYSTYTDADVRAVLANSGSTNIIWNATTNQFELNSTITTDISNNSTSITNLNNLIEDVSGSTKIKATSDIIFENNSIEKMRLDVNGNLGIGVNPPVEPIDIQHIPNGWFKINNFGHLLMRNTQTPYRWNLSIRNTGLFSISSYGGGGQYDNGVMPSTENIISILPNGNVGIDNNNPNSKLDVTGSINATDSITFGGSINTIPASTFAYLANVTSDIQTQINNISSYTDADTRAVLATSAGTDINWNATTNQFDLNPQIQTDITTLNNLIYDDTNANTTYIDALNNFVVNLNGTQSFKCQPNLLEIRTPPTSTSIPFFRLVQALNNHQGQFYISGFGNNDMVMDRIAQANNPNSGVALRVGGQDKIRIDGTGTIVIPNQIGTGNPTNSSYGVECQHGTFAITGSGSFLMENGIFVVGSLTGAGNSIFDVNSSGGSFTRINPLGMMLIKNQNNANRFQIGIRNNGELCIGNDTSTTSGTMGGANDKLKVKPAGEVEVRYNLKVGDANGALLTEISLLNLPTSAPAQANRIWRDTNGFLRIT